MAKKSTSSRRPNRGGGHADEDAFLATVLDAWSWAKENPQVVTIATIVLALGIASGIYYRSYRQDLVSQAAGEFERVQQLVGTGQTETAQNEIRRFIERFGDTQYAGEARMLLAETQLRAGETEEAISTLEPSARDLDDPVSVQAAFLLGTAYENAGRIDDAEALYLRIADEAGMSFQVRDALSDAARIRSRQGNHAGAAELYERILDSYAASDSAGAQESPQRAQERAIYRLRLAEERARSDGG